MRGIRAYGATAVLTVALLVGVPVVHAASWQGPVAISEPADPAGDTPQLAMGPGGDAAVVWRGSGSVMLARHLANGAWSAPVVIGSAQSPVTPLVGVDGRGTVTAVWSDQVGSVTTIATWPAAAAWPVLSTLDQFSTTTMAIEPVVVTQLAVNASGAAVMAGESGSDDVAVAYRASADGSFDFAVEQGTPGHPARDAHVAINAGAAAVLLYRQDDTIWASRRPSALESFAPAEAVNAGLAGARTPNNLCVALDPAGNTLAGFTMSGSAGAAVGSAWSPPGGGWTLQWPLSPQDVTPQGGAAASHTRIVVNAAGLAALVWQQTVPSETSPTYIDVRLGSSATGEWGALESAYLANFALWSGKSFPPAAALGADGTLTVASETAAYPFVGAVARTRTPEGGWGALAAIGPLHLLQGPPSIGSDGRGHVAVATAPDDGTARRVVLVSVFDPVAPVVPPVALAGTRLAGDPVALSVTPSDTWSTTAVRWDLGDGTSADGSAVVHAYDAAGTYVATATVTDAAGNVTSAHAVVEIEAKRARLATAAFRATWKRSRVRGTLLVRGTAPRPGTYTLSVNRGKLNAITRTLQLAAGEFTRSFTLPARLVPGRYSVALAPLFPATQVLPASRDATLAAPASGVVDGVTVTRRGGTMHARFHFVAIARGRLAVTWWITAKGRRTLLARQSKPPRVTIASTVRLRGRRGRVTVTVTRAGAVVAQRSVAAR
ncbi:MAG: hypothetical protein QOH00_736 [Gaiellales bacterium]|jgi:hypothetical protein|nr:hypothetical protein [Gaiellales bacterium]